MPRCIRFYCLLLFALLCETTCAGGYVLTGNVVDFSFPREGLTPAYQKTIRHQSASWGLYNWFPGEKRNPRSSAEIVVYGKARRIVQPYEVAGVLVGIPSRFFAPTYEWNGEVVLLQEKRSVALLAKAVFKSSEEQINRSAGFSSIACGGAVMTLQDEIANYTLIDKAPYPFAVCSFRGKEYTVYITMWRELRAVGKPGTMAEGSGPPNSLLELLRLKNQVFQILDSNGNLVAEYSKFRTTVYDTAPESDVELLFGCAGMLCLIAAIAG
ncbi:MAG: hypothetical protein LBU16_10130 [Treponema sp.]|nr:hypothetical protein [Treponema sp.]